MSGGVDLLHGLLCESLENDHVKFIPRIQNIDQVMSDTVHLLLRHLCGTDIHVAVHLHGIGADDLAADLFREFHRQGGLSGRRRPGDYDQRLFHYMILLNFFSNSLFVIAIMVGFGEGQLVVSLYRRLAGHGGDPVVDGLHILSHTLIGESVDEFHQKVLFRQGEQIVRHRPHRVLVSAERLDLEANVRKHLHVAF